MRDNKNFYMDYEDRSFGGPSPSDYQDGIFSGQFNFGQPPVQPVQPVQPQQGMFGPPPVQPVQPIAAPIQPVQPVQPSPIDNLLKQILGQGTTNWSGVGYGSAEKNAEDMAKILSGIGITDIKQFGPVTREVDAYIGTDDNGTPIYEKQTERTFGNKETGQVVPLTYGGRQTGDFFGGTYQGKGNTGYGVRFDEQGNPQFYTQGASSSDIGKLAPLLTMASFVPGLAPFAQGINALIAAKQGNILGAISGAAGLGGLTDISNAANFAGALKSGNPLAAITTGANLGGIDLGGLVDASGIKDFTRIGDYDITDVVKAAQTAKAIKTGDPSAIISAIGGYMGGQDDRGSPSEPSPAEPYDYPITGTSRFASREVPDPFASVGNEPVPSIEMPDLRAAYPGYTIEPPVASVEDPAASSNVPSKRTVAKKPTYDPVGGGRGGQGGATAEEIAAYNRSQMPISTAKPKTAGDLFTSLFPSAEASTLPSSRQADLASQIPGQSYKAPASTYDDNNSVFGRLGDALGLPQEFQRNFGNTLNALPGLNLPVGALSRGAGAVDELGASAALRAGDGRMYVEPIRLTADPTRMFKLINELPISVFRSPVAQEALQAAASGDGVKAFRLLESNPNTLKELLKYAEKMGAQELSPYKNLKLPNPAEYRSKPGGGFSPKKGGGGRAEGGLASLSNSNKR